MKKLALALPIIALLGCSAFGLQKPVQAFAEDSQESSEVVPEEQESSEPKKFNVDEVVIDGKTIEQWKNELKDSNTRSTAIIGLIVFAAGGFLFVLKWLTEHKIIKATSLLSTANAEEIEKQKKLLAEKTEELKALELQFRDTMESVYQEVKFQLENMSKAQAEYAEESVMARQMLETIMKTDPTLVANGAWREAQKALEAVKDGKKE